MHPSVCRRLNAIIGTALLLSISMAASAASQPDEKALDVVPKSSTPSYEQNSESANNGRLFRNRYTPIVVGVAINDDTSIESSSVQLRKVDGAVIAIGKDIRRWGGSVGSTRAQAAKNDRWYNLQQFPQLKHHYEPALQRLYIGSAYELASQPAEAKNAANDAIGDSITEDGMAIVTNSGTQPTQPRKPGSSPPPMMQPFSGGSPPSTDLRNKAITEASEYKAERRNCEFLTKGVLHANQVNYESLLLNVRINGVNLDSAHQFIRRPCGPLLAPILEMRSWRIKVAGQPNVLIDDNHWLNLNEFEGIQYEVIPESQEILLTVRPDLFSSIELNFEPEYQRPTRSATGGFLNYGVSASRNPMGDMSYGGLLELGVFGPFGSLASDWVFTQFNNDINRIRLNTTFVKDFPRQARRLSVGDINARSGAWGIGYRLGGIQLGSNFGIQPRMQTTPVESLDLLLSEPARLQIYNQEIAPFSDENDGAASFPYYDSDIQRFPSGPVEIYNLPTFGNGIYTATGVTADGSEITQSQNYYYNQGLLKQGLHSYSLELGQIRQGGFTDNYDTTIFTATERYGFTKRLTGEARVEYGDDVIAYGLNLNTVIPWAGVLTATLAQGQPTKSSFGSRGFQAISLNNSYRKLNYNFNFRHFDQRFIHPGEDKDKINNIRHNYTAGVSHRLPWRDSVSLGYNATSNRSTNFNDSITLGYTINSFRIANARFQFRQDIHPTSTWIAFASLSVNFDSIARLLGQGSNRATKQGRLFTPRRSNMTISASQREGGDITSRLRLSTNASRDQESYGLSYSAPLLGEGAYRLGGNYSNRYFTSNAAVTQINGARNYSARINGGIAYLGGALYLSRPIQSSFGVIDLGEDAVGVRVNGVRTNRKGKALIPNLLPYYDNRITVNLGDLPISAEVDEITTTVRPYFRSGVLIEKEISYITDALVQIVLEGKQGPVPLPFGAIVTLDESVEEFPVGDEGYAYIVGVKENSVVRVTYANQKCTIDIPFPEKLEPDDIPELGPFVCKGVTP